MNPVDPFYLEVVNRAIDFIARRIDSNPGLHEVAKAAGFSAFHFHRIFKAVTGETPGDYARRIRLEAGARYLLDGSHSVTETAMKFGFNSSSSFARNFRARYGVQPSKATRDMLRPVDRPDPSAPVSRPLFAGTRMMPAMSILYVRTMNGYDPPVIQSLFRSLVHFAQQAGIAPKDGILMGIGHDDPDYTPMDRCRYDACLALPEGCLPGAATGFNIARLPRRSYAVFTFSGKPAEFYGAWDAVYADWLVRGGYRPVSSQHIEIYLGEESPGSGRYNAELLLPVRLRKTE